MARVSKRLIRIINKKDIISFDIFDTLIKRNCSKPSDIFAIVERKYNNKNNKKIKLFKENRLKAEEEARTKSKLEDIKIDAIYSELERKYEKRICAELKKLEIETEIEFCVKNKKMYKIYRLCKEKGKKIICISDMYLDEKTIRKILERNNYFIDKIYVSSEIGKLKRTGNLFKHVLENNQIKKSKLVHIGDSKKSDFLIPKLLGFKSILIPRKEKNVKFIELKNCDSLDINILNSVINNGVSNEMNQYSRMGYELFGPISYAFCNWLHRNAKKDNVKKLFFCARDMKYIQEVYNIIYGEKAVENEYLYISRKSAILPFLYKNNDFNSFCSVLTDKKMKISSILNSNGISSVKIQNFIDEYGLSKEKDYNQQLIKNNNNFKKLYEEKISKIVKKDGKEQFENFNAYLQKIGFKNNVAIVDLGWKGTIQYCMMNTFKENNLLGYYFGLEKRAYSEIINDKKRAYLFDQNSQNDYEEKVYSFRTLLEIFFAALHGTTISYLKEKDGYYNLGKSENINEKIIIDIQNGAKKFVLDFNKYSIDLSEFDITKIAYNLIEVGINPSLRQANIFGNLNYSNMVDGKLASPQKIYKYILNPKQLKKDIFNSEWKVGFLKRLFKIKLPYYQIYNFLKNRRKK